MKKLILALTSALGLASVAGVGFAQDQMKTTKLQNVVVTGVRAPYETYVSNLDTGYQFQALVGHTHRQYVQAQRTADQLESQRMQGLAQQPVVSVAIDNSSAPGVARQFRLIDADQETVAIVNVYCKRVVPSGGPRCQMAPLTMAGTSGQRVASIRAEDLRVAMVEMRK